MLLRLLISEVASRREPQTLSPLHSGQRAGRGTQTDREGWEGGWKEAFLVFLVCGQLESTDLSKSISALLYFSALDEKLHRSPPAATENPIELLSLRSYGN